VIICLEQSGKDLHMVQLIPLPPHDLLLHYITQLVLEKYWVFAGWMQFLALKQQHQSSIN